MREHRAQKQHQRAEYSQKHSSEKSFTDCKWCLVRKRSEAFESPLSARSDSLWWLWNIQVKKPLERFMWNPNLCVIEADRDAQTAAQSELTAEASYETNACHLLEMNLFDVLLIDSLLCFASRLYFNVIYVHQGPWYWIDKHFCAGDECVSVLNAALMSVSGASAFAPGE